MAKVTVDEFIIELGFTEKVMKGLQKVEKQVQPIAKRIETSLNKAFKVDAGKLTQPGISRMVKNVEIASRKINASLTKAFNVKNLGGQSIKGFEREGMAAARRVAKEMQKAMNQRGNGGRGRPPIPPAGGYGGAGGTGGGSGRPRGRSAAERSDDWRESHNIRNTENGMTRSMANLGLTRELTAYRGQMADLLVKHRGDTTTHAYLREASQLTSSYKDIIRQHRLNAQALERSRYMQHSFQDSTMNLVKGFASVYTALEIFKSSLEEGAKRTQAKTMMNTAFGGQGMTPEIMAAVNQYANKYGVDRTTAMETAAQMRMTMPTKVVSDQDIPKFMETESVFAHQTGMGQDQVGRLNYAMQQIATSTHLMGQDWLQVVNASPALIQQLLKITGKDSVKDLKEFAETMSGADFVGKMKEAMEDLNNKTNAYAAAQNNILAAQGRVSNAVKDAGVDLFDGYEKGFRRLLDSITLMFSHNHENIEGFGAVLGFVFEKLAGVIDLVDTISTNIDGMFIGIGTTFRSLDPDTQEFITSLMDMGKQFAGLAVQITTIALAFGMMRSSAGIIAKVLGAIGGLKAAAAATANATESVAAGAGKGLLARTLGRFGMAEILGYGEVALRAKDLSDATAKVTPGTHNIFQAIWARRHGHAAYDAARAAADERKKGNPLARPLDPNYDPNSNMTDDLFGDARKNWRQFKNAPLWPGMPGGTTAAQKLPPVDFKGVLRIEIPMPDGSVFTTHADVKDLIADNFEKTVTVGTGTGGGWQNPGSNAGWKPSQLMRKS